MSKATISPQLDIDNCMHTRLEHSYYSSRWKPLSSVGGDNKRRPTSLVGWHPLSCFGGNDKRLPIAPVVRRARACLKNIAPLRGD